MRIVKGRFAGRDLVSPNDARVRPTAEHVRDGWLGLLAPWLEGARVLDLFAGTGALGLEAISRGSASADFVETRPSSLHALRANVALFRLRDRTRVFKRDALPFAGALGEDAYDVVFVDPPYGSRMLDRVLDDWRARRFSPLIVVEHALSHDLPRPDQRLVFDETVIAIYRR